MRERLSFWKHAPLLPLMAWQGKRARQRIPLLPEAEGPFLGRVGVGPLLTVAVLGESTVAGVGVATQEHALAFCLARRLAKSRSCSVRIQAVGRNGATAAFAREELVPQIAFPVDTVVVAIGVNDALHLTRGRRWSADIRDLIFDLKKRGARDVVFSSLPPLGNIDTLPQPTRSALGARAAYLDALLQRACLAHGARHLVVRFPKEEKLLSEDRFHPSALGYVAWADELVASLLRRPPARFEANAFA